MLEAIIQLPNNLFYNTGITTYIWLLSNNKSPQRKGKVQLIDASQRFVKLRKNLGAKNCEFTPGNIKEILSAYAEFANIERQTEDGLAVKIFDNSDFGFYKVAIERPKRLKAQFSEERIAGLRFDKTLKEAMEWAWETFGEKVYTDIKTLSKEILSWCEKNGVELNAKKRKAIASATIWNKQKNILMAAQALLNSIGTVEFNDFNEFKNLFEKQVKALDLKLENSEKNAILNAISWYDEAVAKVVKKIQKISGKNLDQLLEHLGCSIEQLPDYGYYPGDKKDEFIIYESESDLRDFENVPLKENIYDYFLREVKPHIDEAWIDLDKIKIGYEISFNKYFYQHKPLRSLEEVSSEILALEKESDGLIAEILSL